MLQVRADVQARMLTAMRKALVSTCTLAIIGCVGCVTSLAEPQGVWLAGDTHVHTDHSSDGSLPRQSSDQRLPGNLPVRDQIAEAERNRLDFLALTDHRTYDQHWDPQWTSSRLLLLPGEEANGSPHAIVLGAIDEIVDGATPSGSPSFRRVQQSIWDAHAQDAVWSVAHPDNGELNADGSPNEFASVLGANAVEVWNPSSDPDAQIRYAEDRWNRGFRFGVVAASDNHYRELWSQAGPGKPTTWVFAREHSQRAILDALAAGRTTVSRNVDGPFVTIEGDFDGNGTFEALGGDEIHAAAGTNAQLRVHVRNGAGMTIYVYRSPGRTAGVAALFHPASADEFLPLPITVADGHSWYRVEARSPGDLSGIKANPLLPDQLRAASAPLFITTGELASPLPEISLPPSDATSDAATLTFDTFGSFASFADISVANDVKHVVAEAHFAGKTFVLYWNSQSATPIQLSSESSNASAPRVAASGLNVWAVWQDGLSRISLRHSADGGVSWEPEILMNSGSAARALHPSLTLVNESCPVVAWAENASGAFDISARVLCTDAVGTNLSARGKIISIGNSFDSRSPRFPASLFPSVAVSRNGKIIVTWQDNRFDPDPLWTGHTPRLGQPASGGTDPDNWEILAAVRSPDNLSWSAPVRVSANEDAADRHPSVAVDATGSIVIAWDSKPLQNSGVNVSIRSSQSSDDASTWSAPQSVGFEPAAMSQRPRLAPDPDGKIRAVWYDTRSSNWRWQVFTARLESSTTWGSPLQLTTGGNSTWPAVSQGVVAFTSDRRSTRSQRDPTQEVFVLAP
jgi:predicted metal-dependent phosphoesterase TrpH